MQDIGNDSGPTATIGVELMRIEEEGWVSNEPEFPGAPVEQEEEWETTAMEPLLEVRISCSLEPHPSSAPC